MEKEKLRDFVFKINDWARDRSINTSDSIPMQELKLIEEVGEIANSYLKKDMQKIKDGIGDVFVVATILCLQKRKLLKLEKEKYIQNRIKCEATSLKANLTMILTIECSTIVTFLYEICDILNLDLLECVELSYKEIKDRKGKTINGTFIKDK